MCVIIVHVNIAGNANAVTNGHGAHASDFALKRKVAMVTHGNFALTLGFQPSQHHAVLANFNASGFICHTVGDRADFQPGAVLCILFEATELYSFFHAVGSGLNPPSEPPNFA
jgi:hypothetical protein